MPRVQEKAITKKLVALGASVLILGLGAVSASKEVMKDLTGGSESVTNIIGANKKQFNEKVIQGTDVTNRIAVIRVEGEIQPTPTNSILGSQGYNHEQILKQFNTAAEDPTVKGILLVVDSPGGGVYESAELRNTIQKIRKDTEKPIFTSFGSMSASGGYYISAETDRIYASEETTTGSIGVIMGSMDLSELMENLGIKENVIKTGAMKDIMSSSREMTKEEREVLETYVNNAFERFLEIVMNGRGLSREEALKIADGRIFDGKQAVENGLVDEIGYEADAIAGLAKKIEAENPVVFEYTTVDANVFNNFLPFKLSFKGESELDSRIEQVWSVIEEQQSPTAQYLYRGGY